LDVKKYISSGILDCYVLGSSSEKEMKEVECMALIYPEIKEELNKLELIFEKFAKASAIEPPPDLRLRILTEIDRVKQIPADTRTQLELNDRIETKTIIPFWLKIAVAASLTLLLAVGGLWIYSDQRKNYFQQRMFASDEEIRLLKNQLDLLEEERKNEAYITYVLAHQATIKINLGGTKLSPESTANIYWNTETSEVFLKVNLLPSPGPDNQYQLWAIVNNNPVDMGVFEIDKTLKGVLKMPYLVKNAMAFAITLEKKGGSPTPTLSAMYVIGNI
jgi:anti-sigma-K factor RskA